MSPFTSSRITRARKPHTCDKCDQVIPAGERYVRHQLGLHHSYPLHIGCALASVNQRGECVYDCQDLREWVEIAPTLGTGPLHPEIVPHSNVIPFPSPAPQSTRAAHEATPPHPRGNRGMSLAPRLGAGALESAWENY